jgi:hypothetical protein
MKFTVTGNRIICCRKDRTATGRQPYRHVVEFDSHVDAVPPHVAARLTKAEVEDLKHFIADRKRIRANPAVTNMFEALPGLLHEATRTVQSVEQMNGDLHDKLHAAVDDLRTALANVRRASTGGLTPVTRMRHSEAQKERLENVRQEL